MFKVLFVTLIAFVSPAMVGATNLTLGEFSKGSLSGWEEKEFEGSTQYSFIFDEQIKQQVLKAESHQGASGLFREQRIDLNKTPYLNWSWKTFSHFPNINENEKSGDDFVARIYVVVDGGVFFWKTIALNYVWSSAHQKDENWDNPFTSNAAMYAVESGRSNLGQWQYYKRNIKEDLKNIVGKDTQYIDAIAIMTDTDNAGLKAITYFGDISFTSE
ncbi:DUF3047 domain-containing protein [Ghiorsea bivora]|uniref:DUF3047 domain-containing protein n=1 Tax=Ghiorsea bivora TaxID=1485545 RepID=UPI000571E3A3|nr:DUF3047 domain-containing protein [Ghiorsea bivora]